jgi:hypothetical protein
VHVPLVQHSVQSAAMSTVSPVGTQLAQNPVVLSQTLVPKHPVLAPVHAVRQAVPPPLQSRLCGHAAGPVPALQVPVPLQVLAVVSWLTPQTAARHTVPDV